MHDQKTGFGEKRASTKTRSFEPKRSTHMAGSSGNLRLLYANPEQKVHPILQKVEKTFLGDILNKFVLNPATEEKINLLRYLLQYYVFQ